MKSKNKLVLEKYLPRSGAMRVRILWGYDMAMVQICACLALELRFDPSLSSVPIGYAREIWKYGLLQMTVVSPIFYAGHLYATVWGVSGIREIMQILLVCLVAALAQFVGILLLDARMSRGYYMLWFVLMAGAVISERVSFQVPQKITDRISCFLKENIPPRVMMIGAGRAGTLILKEMEASERVYRYPVCIVDNGKSKQGWVISDVSIMGSRRGIAKLVREKGIDEIYVTIPTAPPKGIRNALKICQGTGCQVKVLPGVYQLMNGEITISRFRKVEIEDLLGRELVDVNLNEIMSYAKGKVVLVISGGGSTGNELCRQLVFHKAKQLIIFDIYENDACEIQQELERKYPCLDLVVLINSVHSTNCLDYLSHVYRPDIVYHAAAHKHVSLVEDDLDEAIKSNVLGTHRIAGAATKYKMQHSILISTDKTVNPTNIMRVSRRLCEMVIQASSQRSNTEFVAVRFSNVLGSNGGVIPLFKQQIEDGGPMTVTHRDIIRCFMTIPEAVGFVIQAGAHTKGDEIFVLNMGNLVGVLDTAKNLVRLSGYEPYKDIDMCPTGLRSGEKLYEELPMDGEGLQKTVNDKIFIGKPIDMDYNRFEKGLQRLGEAALNEAADVRELVCGLVPEYHYKNMDSDITIARVAASRDFEVIPVNPERFAVHRKIAMYNLGVK